MPFLTDEITLKVCHEPNGSDEDREFMSMLFENHADIFESSVECDLDKVVNESIDTPVVIKRKIHLELEKDEEERKSLGKSRRKKLKTVECGAFMPQFQLKRQWVLIGDLKKGSCQMMQLDGCVDSVWQGLKLVLSILEDAKVIKSNSLRGSGRKQNLWSAFSKSKRFQVCFDISPSTGKTTILNELNIPFYEKNNYKFRLIYPRGDGNRALRRTGVIVNCRNITVKRPMLEILLQDQEYCNVVLCNMGMKVENYKKQKYVK